MRNASRGERGERRVAAATTGPGEPTLPRPRTHGCGNTIGGGGEGVWVATHRTAYCRLGGCCQVHLGTHLRTSASRRKDGVHPSGELIVGHALRDDSWRACQRGLKSDHRRLARFPGRCRLVVLVMPQPRLGRFRVSNPTGLRSPSEVWRRRVLYLCGWSASSGVLSSGVFMRRRGRACRGGRRRSWFEPLVPCSRRPRAVVEGWGGTRWW